MDGVSFVTQCPIPPNTTFTYSFEAANQRGKYVFPVRVPVIKKTKNAPSTSASGITLTYQHNIAMASEVLSSYMVGAS